MCGRSTNPSDRSLDDPALLQHLERLDAPEPSQELLQRLLSVPARQQASRQASRQAARRPWWRPAAALAGTAALTLALAMALTVRPTVAFAQVEAAMTQVRTATWTETGTRYNPDGTEAGPGYRFTNWARLNPPALSRTSGTGIRSLLDEEGHRTYMPPPHDRYILRPDEGKSARSLVLHSVMSPAGQPGGAAEWRSERTELDGRPAVRFSREYGSPGSTAPQHRVRVTETLWAEPGEHRIMRVERRQYYPGSDRLYALTVVEGYRYNEEPPAGTWEWHLPPGRTWSVETSNPVGHELPARDRKAIQALVDRMDSAWVAGDWEQFASTWSFAGLNRFPGIRQSAEARREGWRVRLANLHRRSGWTGMTSRVVSVTAQSFLFPHIGRALPPGAPPVLEVRTSTRVTWSDGHTREVRGFYFLDRPAPGKPYRIIYWSLAERGGGMRDPQHPLPDQPSP